MKVSQSIRIGLALLAAKLSGRIAPLVVNWSLTNRCNYRCKYCSIWSKASKELNTRQVFFIIDELHRCGNRAIAFSGGEPLLRDDISDIIGYCAGKGIYTRLTTNGSLVEDKINCLSQVGFVRVSMDCPKEAHESQRQAGSYDNTIKAVKLLKERNIKVGLNCVISKLNVSHLRVMLEEARRLNVKVNFQPLERRNSEDSISEIIPGPAENKEAFAFLIAEKKKGNKQIANSLPTLRYLHDFPDTAAMKCWAGILAWRIMPDGIIT
ncbi:MAG: radical SAM protein, partial [Candidatus Omnitrophica bacterium]|nr:radical SAM protein [Candidatus Omnitrophota bacterium]